MPSAIPGLFVPGLATPGEVGEVEFFATGDAVYYLNIGGIDLSNVRLQARLTTLESDPHNFAGAALRFRRTDEDNWWEFGLNPGSREYILRKCVNGEIFAVSEPGLSPSPSDYLRVEAYAERITCYINNVMVISVQDTHNQTGPVVGLRFDMGCVDTAMDNFYAVALEEDIRLNLTHHAEYEFFVDWDQDGGLNIGDFEITTDGWTTFGSSLPVISISDIFVRSGSRSLEIDWNIWNPFQFDVVGHGFSQGTFGGEEFNNPPTPFKFDGAGQGFDDGFFAVTKFDNSPTQEEPSFTAPGIQKTMTKLIPGREYTLRTWVYTPGLGTFTSIGVKGIGSSSSTLRNAWEEVTFTYTATATEHTLIIFSTTPNPTNESISYVDEVMNVGAYEDISCYVIGDRGDIQFRYGRDQARSLASIAPGEVELELDNTSQIFSPDNPGSVLAGFLAPGKPMMIRATYNDRATNIFHGFVDNYTLHPDPEDRSVLMTGMDVLQYLSNAKVTSDLYPSIQTGEAINIILDAVNWPVEKRFVDQGATTIRWWCIDDESGLESVQALVEAEGLPSIAHVDAFGNFVFRSRHHRLRRTESTAIQGVFRSCAEYDEPNFSSPITYDIGWKDIINQVKVDIDERGAEEFGEVWSQDDLISIPKGETHTINITTSDPFFGAIQPTVANEDIELMLGSGPLADVNMSRTSGKSTIITLTAGASQDVLVGRIQVRAYSVPVLRTRKLVTEDSESVDTYGPQTVTDGFGEVNYNDMASIANVLLGHRSDRLPVVNIDLNNGHPIRISHMLNRHLSDRIHIVEMEQTFMNDDYFIEVLEHKISDTGGHHTLTLGCERARDQVVVDESEEGPPIFTFDVAGQGFDDGFFSPEGSGFTLANTLFILDESVLGEDGLGF